jgi:lipopolysaccharide export LptBFGC system permease protein LptF
MYELLILLLIPLSIIMIIIYFRTRKLYTLSFSVSALIYVIAMFFTVNVFDVKKEIIFLALIFSAILMTLVGLYLAKHEKRK